MKRRTIWITALAVCVWLAGCRGSADSVGGPVYDAYGVYEDHEKRSQAIYQDHLGDFYDAYQKKTGAHGMSAHTMETLMQFYLNGKRSVSEVAQCVQCDTLIECHEVVSAFVELLEALGLVKIV